MIEIPSYKAWVALVTIDKKEVARFPVDDPNAFKYRQPITGWVTPFICTSKDEPFEDGYREGHWGLSAHEGEIIICNFNTPPRSWGDIA